MRIGTVRGVFCVNDHLPRKATRYIKSFSSFFLQINSGETVEHGQYNVINVLIVQKKNRFFYQKMVYKACGYRLWCLIRTDNKTGL